jgi:hypothetical protein
MLREPEVENCQLTVDKVRQFVAGQLEPELVRSSQSKN